MYERAWGYACVQQKVFPAKPGQPAQVVDYIERFPPDTNAAMFILTNREPDLWSNKQTVEHEIGSKLADRLEAARLRALQRLVDPTIVDAVATEVPLEPQR
jgi:hypothetical protein